MSRHITLVEELSPNEQKMFKDLGWSYLFEVINFNPMSLYQMATERAFIEEEESEEESVLSKELWFNRWFAIKALKRAVEHLRKGKYRANNEFEELIKI